MRPSNKLSINLKKKKNEELNEIEDELYIWTIHMNVDDKS